MVTDDEQHRWLLFLSAYADAGGCLDKPDRDDATRDAGYYDARAIGGWIAEGFLERPDPDQDRACLTNKGWLELWRLVRRFGYDATGGRT